MQKLHSKKGAAARNRESAVLSTTLHPQTAMIPIFIFNQQYNAKVLSEISQYRLHTATQSQK